MVPTRQQAGLSGPSHYNGAFPAQFLDEGVTE